MTCGLSLRKPITESAQRESPGPGNEWVRQPKGTSEARPAGESEGTHRQGLSGSPPYALSMCFAAQDETMVRPLVTSTVLGVAGVPVLTVYHPGDRCRIRGKGPVIHEE